MANPVIKTCLANEWTLVASNVTAGSLKKLDSSPNLYLETYRMHSGTAPTDRTEGAPCFMIDGQEEIKAAAAIDVYIYAVGQDGAVRVDI